MKEKFREIILELKLEFESNSSQTQINALDSCIELIIDLAKEAVHSLRDNEISLFVGERLLKLGSLIVPELEARLGTATSNEKIILSLLLLQLGGKASISCLLDAVVNNEDYGLICANKLATINILEAAEKIIERLYQTDVDNTDTIVSLLISLKTLNAKLPLDLFARYSSSESPWQIKSIVDTLQERH